MDAILERCAGLDVHKEKVVACVMYGPLDSKPKEESKTFATSGLTIKFITVGDKEICRIDISKSNKPLYLEISDNGQKSDKFYVRSGNTSQELGVKEIGEYLKTRFN